MKLFSLFLLVFFNSSAFGQIEYTPVLERDEYAIWKIKDKNGNVYQFDPFEQHSSFDLPDTGTYLLSTVYEELEPMEIRVTTDKQVDTFFFPCLEIPLIISNPPPTRYRFYGEIANGYCADYYKKGKLRREGTFKNGHPTDTVKTYFYSGEIKELVIPLRKGTNYVYYHQNGTIEREYNSKTSTDKEYYESGQLSLIRQYKKRARSTKIEYYENGEIKRKQQRGKEIRFHSDGRVSDELKWIKPYNYFDRNFRGHVTNWKKFDIHGNVQMEITFDRLEREYPNFPLTLEQIEGNDFDEILFFEQGKPTRKLLVELDFINDELVYMVIFYKMANRKWVKQRQGSLDELPNFF